MQEKCKVFVRSKRCGYQSKPFQCHIGGGNLSLSGETTFMNQLQQFFWCDQQVFDDFYGVNLLVACFTHVSCKVPPDARFCSRRISMHVRQGFNLVIVEAIARLFHQFSPGCNQWVILVSIDTAGRELQDLAANPMLILFINQKTSIFRNGYNAYPATIFDNIIVWNDGAVGNRHLFAAYFQVRGIQNLSKRECSPWGMSGHNSSLNDDLPVFPLGFTFFQKCM